MDRITIVSLSEDNVVDELEREFRLPLRQEGVRLICRRRPKGMRYSAVHPYIVTVVASVLSKVLSNYFIKFIDFVVARRRRYAPRSVLFVLIIRADQKRFVLPKQAGEAKRHLRQASKKPQDRSERAGSRKPVRGKRK